MCYYVNELTIDSRIHMNPIPRCSSTGRCERTDGLSTPSASLKLDADGRVTLTTLYAASHAIGTSLWDDGV